MESKPSAVIVYHSAQSDREWMVYLKKELTSKFSDRIKVVSIGLENIPPPTEARKNVSSSVLPRIQMPQGILIVVLTNDHLRFLMSRPALDYRKAVITNGLTFTPESSYIFHFDSVDFKQTDVSGVPLEKRFEQFSKWNLILYKDTEKLLKSIGGVVDKTSANVPPRSGAAMKAKLISDAVKCDESIEITIVIEEGLPANSTVQVYLNLPGNPNDFPARTNICNSYVVTFKTFEHVECQVGVRMTVNGAEVNLEPNTLRYTSSFRDISAISQFYMEIVDVLVKKLVSLKVSTDSLDRLMSSVFSSNNLPVQAFEFVFSLMLDHSSEFEYPSLLHLAAANGLKTFCSTLHDLPNAQCALEKKNGKGKLPEELAADAGHKDLAGFLGDSRKGNLDDFYVSFVKKSNLNDADDTYIQSRVKYLKFKGSREEVENEIYVPEYVYSDRKPKSKGASKSTSGNRQVQLRQPNETERKQPNRLSEELVRLIRQFIGQEVSMAMTEVQLGELKAQYYSNCKNFDEKRKHAKIISDQIEKAKQKMKEEFDDKSTLKRL